MGENNFNLYLNTIPSFTPQRWMESNMKHRAQIYYMPFIHSSVGLFTYYWLIVLFSTFIVSKKQGWSLM